MRYFYIDIDECMEGTNPCVLETSSHCVNTIGSYSCQENVCNRTPGQINYYRGGGCCTITNGEYPWILSQLFVRNLIFLNF